MREVRGTLGVLLAAAGWWLVSCRDVPTPPEGVHSVSEIFLPAPSVVVGDTLRDSAGVVAPLRVIAFDVAGLPLDPQPVTTFVVIDTGAHFVDTAFVVGDSLGDTVQVVGTIATIQTRPSPIVITLEPDTLVAADSTLQRITRTIVASDTALNSPPLNVIVQNLAGTPAAPPTGVPAVVVYYTIDRAPPGPGPGGGPTVVLLPSATSNQVSSRDTTNTGGQASRVARLRFNGSAFVADTVLVSATSSYRGVSIGTVQFTLIFTKQ